MVDRHDEMLIIGGSQTTPKALFPYVVPAYFNVPKNYLLLSPWMTI